MGAFGARGLGDAGGDVHTTYRHALAASSPGLRCCCERPWPRSGGPQRETPKAHAAIPGNTFTARVDVDLNQAVREQLDNVTC